MSFNTDGVRLLMLAPLCFLVASCITDVNETQYEPGIQGITDVALVEEPVLDSFGIEAEKYDVHTYRIRRNDNLSGILTQYSISHPTVNGIVNASRGIFDVRRIVAGRPMHIYTSADSLQRVEHIVYEHSYRDYVVFSLGEEITVRAEQKELEKRLRYVEGIINGSLYATLTEAGADPALVSEMASVFAWQVDFYRIQRGDSFRVLYEEELIEGIPVSIGKIKAAQLLHFGREYNAIHYVQDGRVEYFDTDGNSLRKAFLRAPLEYTRISSRFTNRRFHPILRRNIPHHGTDYAAPTGTPIRAVGDGVVTRSAFDRNNGNYVRIRHNSVYETGYLHMSRIANGIRPGASVSQGQIIGYVGSTGLATGPHLCFRFWKNGQPVDPHRVEMPSSDPIQNSHKLAFEMRRDHLLTLLDSGTSVNEPPAWSISSQIAGRYPALSQPLIVQPISF
ncbi:MAG: peptidase M23 [Balneolaceae bacterium]|nr:MAG: peptidase M23 [Balneolaceae bacterium]